MNTLNDAYKSAMDIQNACNMSGIINAFSRATKIMRENGLSTAEINKHAITILFADKIYDLTGRPDFKEYHKSYNEVNGNANQVLHM